MRLFVLASLLLALAAAVACGTDNNHPAAPASALSGNWQVTLLRHSNPAPETFSGFLQQSGESVSGTFILGDGCSGVGPVSGSLKGQNLQLDVDEFGQDLSMSGTLPSGSPSGSTFMSGQFSALGGGCTSFPSTGTWSATQVLPIAGPFHGTLVSVSGVTLNVTGTLTQGPNTGLSNANLTGSITLPGATSFCAYLTTATITGLISGTSVILNLYGPDGSQSGQIPASVSPSGTMMSGNYAFTQISKSCGGDQGKIQLTFP